MRSIPFARAWVIAGTLGLAAGIAQPSSAATTTFTLGGGAQTFNFSGTCDTVTGCNGDNNGIPPFDLGFAGTVSLDPLSTSTNWLLDFSLTNTTTGGDSSFDNLGFVTSPDASSVSMDDPGTVFTGVTLTDNGNTIPGFKSVEICAYAPNSSDKCGSASGDTGIQSGLSDAFTLLLVTAASQTLELGNFAVKYTAVGPQGQSFEFGGGNGNVIPIPASLPLLLTAFGGLGGLGFLGRRRRQMAEA